MEEKNLLLLVDDETDLREVNARFLRSAGYQVIEAACGEDGFRLAQEKRPDIMLLDVMLPDINGLEICKRIKADPDLSHIFVIMLSSYVNAPQDQTAGLYEGADMYLARPVSNLYLLAQVRAMMRIKSREKVFRKEMAGKNRELIEMNQRLREEMAIRSRSEERLKNSEERFRIFVENTDDLITQVDAGGRFVYVNNTAEFIFGVRPDRCVGMSAFKFIHPQDRETTQQAFQNWLDQHLVSIRHENRQVHIATGRISHIRWTINLHWKSNGELSHINSIGHDLTVQKRNERTLQNQTRQLTERVKELHCLYRVSAVIARHDLSLEDILTQILTIIPDGWQYPDIAAARICAEDREWRTDNYRSTPWVLGCPIRIGEDAVGQVEVVYLNEIPAGDAELFLDEERDLIQAIAAQLAQVIKRNRSDQALQRELEIKGAGAELASALITSTSFNDICDKVLDFSKRLTNSPFGYVGYIDPDTGHLISPTMTRDIWEACRVQGKSIVFEHFAGLWGWVLDNKKPLLSNTPADDARSSGIPDGHVSIDRFMSAPALLDGHLVGQISLANASRAYTDRDLEFLQQIAALFAIAIQRQRTEEKLNKLNQELEARVQKRTAELEGEIKERQSFENKLFRSKKILQAVVDGISDPLIMVDKQMMVMLLNTAALKYYQVAFADAIGKPCHLAFLRQPSPCTGCRVAEVLARGRELIFERKGFMAPDRYEQVAVYPVSTEDGTGGAVMRISDITESKKIQERLIRADRLSSLGQLSGGIAHEIRNPLAGISLFADILGDPEKFDRSEQEQEILEEIKSNIGKIDGIIRQVLDFARPAVEKKGQVDINRLIRDCLKLWTTRMLKTGIQLDLHLPEGLSRLSGNPIGIQQVVTNLIQNAVEAMQDDPGTLSILTSQGRSAARPATDVIRIQVRDTGPGIRAEDRENIFNPFFTTKPTGTGLGLAMCHQIVRYHDGHLSVRSEPGRGAVFTAEFPIFKEGE